MAFHNYDAVKKVQEERERNEGIDKESENDDIFFKQLQDLGINVDKDALNKNRKRSSKDDDEEDFEDDELDEMRVMKRE
jgi:pyruvate/2-oxoglutarate dehydrogenase complex dihydrolipoamide acyltransferase (E2) component